MWSSRWPPLSKPFLVYALNRGNKRGKNCALPQLFIDSGLTGLSVSGVLQLIIQTQLIALRGRYAD